MTLSGAEDFLQAIPLPAVLITRDERIEAANNGAFELLGHSITGRHFITALRQPVLLDAIELTLRDQTPREAPFLTNDGQQDTTFRVSVRPVFRETGAPVLVCFEDMTPVAQAGQMRRDFVANVSHELKTPLTALLGFIETLKTSARDDAAARDRFLTIMTSEADRMNRMVTDLLALSRVETDERVRPTTPVDPAALIRLAVTALAPQAERAGVAVAVHMPDQPVRVPADADQLRQVFTNLIENAIKYGGAGGQVTVTLTEPAFIPRLRGQGVVITVEDKGPGIDPVHLPRLTERFYRVDAHRSREQGGTGLGLAIVKHIINRHRGRLRIESKLGQGTTVTVLLATG